MKRLPLVLSSAALAVAVLGAVSDGFGAGGAHAPSRTESGARPAGPVRDVEYVEATSPLGSTTVRTVAARCPRGKIPVGGGAVPTSSSPGFPVYLRYSAPTEDAWVAQAQESARFEGKWRLKAIAICAAAE